MTTKYRIVDFQNKPLSSWTPDRKHLDDYIAEREPDLGKQRVQSTDEIQFRFQSREEFTKGVNAQVEYELAMTADYREEQFELAANAADAGDDIDDSSIEMSSADFVKVPLARAAEKEA
jgi:hypothetical protein